MFNLIMVRTYLANVSNRCSRQLQGKNENDYSKIILHQNQFRTKSLRTNLTYLNFCRIKLETSLC